MPFIASVNIRKVDLPLVDIARNAIEHLKEVKELKENRGLPKHVIASIDERILAINHRFSCMLTLDELGVYKE